MSIRNPKANAIKVMTIRLVSSLCIGILCSIMTCECAHAEQAGNGDTRALSKFFRSHCVKCHGPRERQSGVRLDQLDHNITDQAILTSWQDVLDVLNTGEMPPEEQKQPAQKELSRVIGIITQNIADAQKRLAATGGVISMRHLTKREYLGSIRDLFGGDVPSEILPADIAGGFDTNGSEQFFSLKQYENFYKAGKGVVERTLFTIATPVPDSAVIRHDPEIKPAAAAKQKYEQMVRVMELINAGAPITEISKVDPKVADAGQVRLFTQRYEKRIQKPKADFERTQGRDGVSGRFEYLANVRPRSRYRLKVHALESKGNPVVVLVNGQPAGEFHLEAGQNKSAEILIATGLFDSSINIRVEGNRNDDYDFLTLDGPLVDSDRSHSFVESIIVPFLKGQVVDDQAVASMLKQIAERAFRYQGVGDDYVAELVKVYKLERSNGKDVASALVEPLTAIITSPAFLYIKEKNNGTRSLLSQHEFAIRVSYFLWGSPPDQQLYDLARSGKLYDRSVMLAQFERMIESERADVFLTDFINQWADIRRFDEIDLPVGMIRNGLADSCRQELSEFFKVLVREDQPVDKLIDSDFVVVNQQLASYYGLKTDDDDGFQKVPLPKRSPRGGILGQAAFLIMGTSGGRTSPTIRGTLIRECLLHDPPPPPPPNIPAIENEKGVRLTVKQLVDRHKDVAQCASCHDKIDPIGYGLENFDYLGKWRDTEQVGPTPKKRKGKNAKSAAKEPSEVAIDASGHIDSESFQGFVSLKQVLKGKREQLARSLFESMLAYGIGRDVEFVDEGYVNENLSQLEKHNYPLKEMIFEVITSKPFVTK